MHRLRKMLLIKILFFRWHKISPEGYRQVSTKIDKHRLCQLNNVILNSLSGLDLVRRSRSHVKGHRRGGVCVLRMLLVAVLWLIGVLSFYFLSQDELAKIKMTDLENQLYDAEVSGIQLVRIR